MTDDSPWPETATLEDLTRRGGSRTLSAGPDQRAAIARYLDVDSVEALDAEVDIKPWHDGVELSARWSAAYTQTCGVTLEPLHERKEGAFTVRIVPFGSPLATPPETPEVEIDLEADDPPDVAESGRVDLGFYVVEHLALEVDPYPRKPGVEFEAPEPENPPSPFAVLKTLEPR
ncbi:MAG: YceD family protein [Caulobacteraceae bacterium]